MYHSMQCIYVCIHILCTPTNCCINMCVSSCNSRLLSSSYEQTLDLSRTATRETCSPSPCSKLSECRIVGFERQALFASFWCEMENWIGESRCASGAEARAGPGNVGPSLGSNWLSGYSALPSTRQRDGWSACLWRELAITLCCSCKKRFAEGCGCLI